MLTVASGRTAIVKSLTLANTHATDAATFAIGLNGDASGNRLFTVTLAASTSQVISLFLALNPGDFIRAIRTGTGSAVLAGFGSLLEGEPS